MILAEQQQRLEELVKAFLAENASINLSAFRTPEACWIGNVLDSIAVLDVDLPPSPALPPKGEKLEVGEKLAFQKNILDLGTGGGFPLLPLAICRPEWNCVGLDATQKKLHAIDRIVQTLALTNVSLLAGRSEELGHDPVHREQYDLVLSRAVAPINTLLEYCAPFTKVGGKIILWKSLTIDQELKDSLLARAELSCHLIKQYVYELPGDWGKRQLLIFEKTFITSKEYPRAIGIPKISPLL